MTDRGAEVSYVEYKIPAKELRKLAETSIYSNLDCENIFLIHFLFTPEILFNHFSR